MINSNQSGKSIPKILIVDDQPLNIQLLYKILGNEYELFMATSGKEAIKVCEETNLDLILLDVMMPEMDGHEVCKSLKQNPKTSNIPVIFVTAQNNPEEEALGLGVGAVDFISKPLNAPVVRARVRTHIALKLQSDFLRTLAFIDGLTGIANRRHFDEKIEMEWRDCRRNQYPLSLILIDIDHFKKFNDHYGHQAGDDCLRAVGKLLNTCLGRAHDLAARYGGEEFVCILPNCHLEGAIKLATKIKDKVYSLAIPHANSSTADCVSISAGVSCLVPTEDLQFTKLIAAADMMLYTAKAEGRNRVCG